jgi:L-ascorbate metabolism protein UlaG (beta-lactamase superfamily)
MGLDRNTQITWYGHACVQVVTPGGKTILFDPWFGNPLSPKAAGDVDRCDVLLVSHGHGDHLGDALPLASRLRPAWPAIHELSLWLARQLPGGGDQVTGMNKGGTVEVAGLNVTMTRADHSAGDWNADGGVPLYLGEPAGFVVELENGFRIYHAGDTDVFGDMAIIRDLHRPDLAILPIGEWHAGPAAGGPHRTQPGLRRGLRASSGRDHLVGPLPSRQNRNGPAPWGDRAEVGSDDLPRRGGLTARVEEDRGQRISQRPMSGALPTKGVVSVPRVTPLLTAGEPTSSR